MIFTGRQKIYRFVCKLLLTWVVFISHQTAMAAAAPSAIALFHHGDSPSYQELILSLRESLALSNPASSVKTINIASSTLTQANLSSLATSAPIYLAVGTRAAERLMSLEPDKPVLTVLIPKQSAEEIITKYRPASGQFAAIYMDQPPQRILRLIQILLPQAKTLGVLATPATTGIRDEMIAAANAARVKTITATITQSSQLYQELPKLLDQSDALYPLPDPRIYASTSIEYLFLTSYRKHVPIIGFSETSVRAGAVAAVYSTPTQVGKQLANSIRAILSGTTDIISNNYPLQFDVKINLQVARSLGLKHPDEATVLQRLQSSEIRK